MKREGMSKYCEHCGKEISGRNFCTLDFLQTFYSNKEFKRAGVGMALCMDCYNLRQELHYNLDKEFLYNKKGK
jgi:hypothetical protein